MNKPKNNFKTTTVNKNFSLLKLIMFNNKTRSAAEQDQRRGTRGIKQLVLF